MRNPVPTTPNDPSCPGASSPSLSSLQYNKFEDNAQSVQTGDIDGAFKPAVGNRADDPEERAIVGQPVAPDGKCRPP